MTTHINKVHQVSTISKVARDLGEDEDWLRDVANEMEIEGGAIWLFGVGADSVQAFTDFGIERLIELIRILPFRSALCPTCMECSVSSRAGIASSPLPINTDRACPRPRPSPAERAGRPFGSW